MYMTPIFLWSVVVSHETTALRRRPGSGTSVAGLVSVTAAISCSRLPRSDSSFDHEVAVHPGVHVALEVVVARVEPVHLVRRLTGRRHGVADARRPAKELAALGRVLRVHGHVVRDPGVVLVREVDGEGLPGRRGEAVRVELDGRDRVDLEIGPRRRALPALGLLR